MYRILIIKQFFKKLFFQNINLDSIAIYPDLGIRNSYTTKNKIHKLWV